MSLGRLALSVVLREEGCNLSSSPFKLYMVFCCLGNEEKKKLRDLNSSVTTLSFLLVDPGQPATTLQVSLARRETTPCLIWMHLPMLESDLTTVAPHGQRLATKLGYLGREHTIGPLTSYERICRAARDMSWTGAAAPSS